MKVRDTVIRNPGNIVLLKSLLTADLSFTAYLKSIVYTLPMSMDALYDNSKPFSKFLAKEGLEKILHETNVLLREKHTIVPHVCCYAWRPSRVSFSINLHSCSATWFHWKHHQMHYPNFPMRRAGITMYVRYQSCS